MQDNCAAELDERAAGVGLRVRTRGMRVVVPRGGICGGAAPPVHECLIGDSVLAAESGGALVGVLEIAENTGLLLVGVACA